ncbi:DHH family phosphoesterase [candidate division WOR-3 bacterium]|nr:DHH family phosphoesterase [candidate division WOR-3 bacterium]
MPSAEKFIEKVISKRNLTENFLTEDIWLDSPGIPQFEKALKVIRQTMENKGQILIWGDQDCDGISAASLLYLALSSSAAKVRAYIPDRKAEGIGMNLESLKREIQKNKTDLVITVDCCSRDTVAASYLSDEGVKLVVTDHHQIPASYLGDRIIVNCHRHDSDYLFDDLSGSGLALKFALEFSQDPYLWLLASLGTISDRVPLVGENRTIVKRGIEALDKFRFQAIDLLCSFQESSVPETTEEIKRIIISPISSDMSVEGSSLSFNFLTDSPDTTSAESMVKRSRKWIEARETALSKAESMKKNIGHFVVFRDKDAPRGILGSIASKLTLSETKPAFVVGALDENSFETVEGRTIYGDVLSVLEERQNLFSSFGGHKKACGAKIESSKVGEFFKALEKSGLGGLFRRKIRIDFSAKKDQITDDVLATLSRFGPFGQDFPEISIEILDMPVSKKIEGRNIFLVDEKGKIREANSSDDIWEYE